MATYASDVSLGNWSAAATWGKSDAVGDQLIGNTSQLVTTTLQLSANAALGINTIDGVLINVASLSANPLGTVTVLIRNTTASTTLGSVIVNASDFDTNGNGWYFMNFASPIATVGATNYAVGVSSSVTNTIGLYTNAVANNWNTAYITNTTGNPTTGDNVFVTTQMNSVGNSTKNKVIMDNNTQALYQRLDIGPSASLKYSTSATTNLSLSGNVQVWGNGVLEIGNAVTSMSATLTGSLLFTCSANGSASLYIQPGGIFNAYGAPLNFISTKLSASANSGQATLTVVDATGWRANDQIVICGHQQAQSEQLTVSSTGATSVVCTTNLANTHSGSSFTTYAGVLDTRCDVVNISRNVLIKSVGSFTSSTQFITSSSATCKYVEFNIMPITCSTNGSGFGLIQYSSIHNCLFNPSTQSVAGILTLSAITTATFTADSNIFYVNGTGIPFIRCNYNTVQALYTLSNNFFIKLLGNAVNFNSIPNFIGNTCNDMNVACFAFPTSLANFGTFSGNTIYGFATIPIVLNFSSVAASLTSSSTGFLVSNQKIWGGSVDAIVLQSSINAGVIFDGLTAFSNSHHIRPNFCMDFTLTNSLFASRVPAGLPNQTTIQAINMNGTMAGMKIINSCLGVSGSYSGYTTADIAISNAILAGPQIKSYSCSSEFIAPFSFVQATMNNIPDDSFISFQKHQGVTGNNFSYVRGGQISWNSLSAEAGNQACVQMAPNVATGSSLPLRQTTHIPVSNNTIRIVTVRMMKDSAYTGSNPQVTLNFRGVSLTSASFAVGTGPANYTDCVIAAAASNFDESGGMQVFVDAFGSAGNIYCQSIKWT